MKEDYPCVSGIFALSGQVPSYNIGNSKTLFVDAQKRIIVYQFGNSANIHFHNNENQMLVVSGRIYDPVYLAPSTQNKVSAMERLFNLLDPPLEPI